MFVHHIDPIIFSLGPLSIHWYGLAYVIGFLLTYWWMRRPKTISKIKGFTKEHTDTFVTYIILGVVIGGRVLQFVFYRPLELVTKPLEIFMVWHGGMSFHGGLIGALFAAWLFCRKYKINLLELADQVVIPASFALALGRIANYINAEMWGTVTNVPWCVVFPGSIDPTTGEALCRHPTQIYESLKTFFIFGVLLWNDHRIEAKNRTKSKNKRKNYVVGTQLWLFITLYGFLRFALNFYRDETPLPLLGFSMGQLLSLLMGLGGLGILLWNKYRAK